MDPAIIAAIIGIIPAMISLLFFICKEWKETKQKEKIWNTIKKSWFILVAILALLVSILTIIYFYSIYKKDFANIKENSAVTNEQLNLIVSPGIQYQVIAFYNNFQNAINNKESVDRFFSLDYKDPNDINKEAAVKMWSNYQGTITFGIDSVFFESEKRDKIKVRVYVNDQSHCTTDILQFENDELKIIREE